jgi:hypothetical protein
MAGKAGKQWSGLNITEKITLAFKGFNSQVKGFKDTLESLFLEIKLWNKLQESKGDELFVLIGVLREHEGIDQCTAYFADPPWGN